MINPQISPQSRHLPPMAAHESHEGAVQSSVRNLQRSTLVISNLWTSKARHSDHSETELHTTPYRVHRTLSHSAQDSHSHKVNGIHTQPCECAPSPESRAFWRPLCTLSWQFEPQILFKLGGCAYLKDLTGYSAPCQTSRQDSKLMGNGDLSLW